MIPALGIIGIGGFARFYLSKLVPYAKENKIRFAAAVVRSPEKYPDLVSELQGLDCRIFPDSDSMHREMSGQLDLLCIPTSIDTHCQYTCEALSHGCNVLVEKPVAGTVHEVEQMMAAEASAGGKWVAVGFQHIYSPEIQELKQRLGSGEFGGIRKIIAMGRWPRPDAYYRRNEWAARLKTPSGAVVNDSPINNAFAHYLNISLFLAGREFTKPALPVKVSSRLFRARPIETFDTCEVEIRTDSNIRLVNLFTHACEVNEQPKIKIECENAVILWHNDGFYQVMNHAGQILETSATYNAHEHMFEALLDKVRNPAAFCCTLEIAMAHTASIEMLHRNMVVQEIPPRELKVKADDGQRIIQWVPNVFDRIFHSR